jgi:hypothetical protein
MSEKTHGECASFLDDCDIRQRFTPLLGGPSLRTRAARLHNESVSGEPISRLTRSKSRVVSSRPCYRHQIFQSCSPSSLSIKGPFEHSFDHRQQSFLGHSPAEYSFSDMGFRQKKVPSSLWEIVRRPRTRENDEEDLLTLLW